MGGTNGIADSISAVAPPTISAKSNVGTVSVEKKVDSEIV